MTTQLRRSAEEIFAEEFAALDRGDKAERPTNWRLSPRAVVTYLLGGTAADGTVISPKYVGNQRLIETAVATRSSARLTTICWCWRSWRTTPPSPTRSRQFSVAASTMPSQAAIEARGSSAAKPGIEQ